MNRYNLDGNPFPVTALGESHYHNPKATKERRAREVADHTSQLRQTIPSELFGKEIRREEENKKAKRRRKRRKEMKID